MQIRSYASHAYHSNIQQATGFDNCNENQYPRDDTEIAADRAADDKLIPAQKQLAYLFIMMAGSISNLHFKGKSYIVQTNCHMQRQEAHMMNARQKLTFHKFKTVLTIPFKLP